jgi:DNA-directed RNA polymerase sigma subunit (sigma70/sigma32)
VLADAPPAGDEVDPARQVARPKARETLEAALSSTPATEAGILRLRYGLAGCELATYEEVERMLGISLEGARQTAARALSALRERLQVTARCP